MSYSQLSCRHACTTIAESTGKCDVQRFSALHTPGWPEQSHPLTHAAAQAAQAADLDLGLACYNFGAPRVGNHAFALNFLEAVPDTWIWQRPHFDLWPACSCNRRQVRCGQDSHARTADGEQEGHWMQDWQGWLRLASLANMEATAFSWLQ